MLKINYFLIILITALLFIVYEKALSSMDDNLDVRKVLVDGFRKSDHRKWSEEALKSLVDDIIVLSQKKGQYLTIDQARTISISLKDLPDFLAIEENTHPILKVKLREEVLYAIENYLEYGNREPNECQKYFNQISLMVKTFSDNLINMYPSKKETILHGMKKTLDNLQRRSNNPLLAEGKNSVTIIILEKAKEKWNFEKDKFVFADNTDVELSTSIISALFHRSLVPIIEGSCGEMIDQPESLKKIREEYKNNIYEINKYNNSKQEKEIKEWRSMLELKIINEEAKYSVDESLKDLVEYGTQSSKKPIIAESSEKNLLLAKESQDDRYDKRTLIESLQKGRGIQKNDNNKSFISKKLIMLISSISICLGILIVYSTKKIITKWDKW